MKYPSQDNRLPGRHSHGATVMFWRNILLPSSALKSISVWSSEMLVTAHYITQCHEPGRSPQQNTSDLPGICEVDACRETKRNDFPFMNSFYVHCAKKIDETKYIRVPIGLGLWLESIKFESQQGFRLLWGRFRTTLFSLFKQMRG
jgi:hypothetical protein